MVIWFSARVLNYFSGSEENISGEKGKRELSSDQLLNEVENYSIVKAIGTERETLSHLRQLSSYEAQMELKRDCL